MLSEDLAPYMSYQDEELLALIQQDDRLAAVAYIRKGKSDDRCARSEIAIKTGVTGNAIQFLYRCALNTADDIHQHDKKLSRELVLEALSVIKFATLRGDYKYVGYGDRHLKNFGFEQGDFAGIRSLAMDRLNNINHYRLSLGFPPFAVQTTSHGRELELRTSNRDQLTDWQKDLLSN